MKRPIGVFDSGLGGISVLAQMMISLPEESYVYYGDSKNAPYGEKSKEEVLTYSLDISKKLLDQKAKAMVVACNTATSAAIKDLRGMFDIPIIGMEPAVKPALNMKNIQRVVVMATPFTLREKKFHELVQNLDTNKKIVKLPCPGLVQLIEHEGGSGPRVREYLKKLFIFNNITQGDVMVLGCTHYVFLAETIRELFDKQVPVVHGNTGTVLELENQLRNKKLLYSKDDDTLNQRVLKEKWRLPVKEQDLKRNVQIFNSHEDSSFNRKGWDLLRYEMKKMLK